MTDPSATRSWPLPQPTSSDFWSTPSSEASRSLQPSPRRTFDIAAYNDGYQGFGGYGYCHYLFVTDNSPLPWTACAFIAYMVNTADGFSAWGKDIGGYSSNPDVAAETEAIYQHQTGGMAEDGVTVVFPALNDRGGDWWLSGDRLVIEDPAYCASVSFTVGSWIEMLSKYTPQ